MRNCSAICAEMVVQMVEVGEAQGDAASAIISGIIVAHVRSLNQELVIGPRIARIN